jgi:hypothetical protein
MVILLVVDLVIITSDLRGCDIQLLVIPAVVVLIVVIGDPFSYGIGCNY